MKRFRNPMVVIAAAAVVVACVTINVYFPEAAAERAADRFIQDVIGPETGGDEVSMRLPSAPVERLLGWLVPSAHAQSADIDVQTPQIRNLRDQMAERHRLHLAGWFDAGAIGLGNDGLVVIRDRSAVGLAERRQLEQVVAAENADRRAVYREIAVANGHPEWEDQIRETFARRWIANARPGWFYQDNAGNWQQK
ncbi:MAG: YdbL family protein [Wenzhouxiangellaceae bacterium]|nr:YdbL family protein [Wenzhouxiangellaceae bacterium]